MTQALQIVLGSLAGIGLAFVLIALAALVLAFLPNSISPEHDGRLVSEGRNPVSGSEAQDSSRRGTLEEVTKGNLQ